MASLRCVVPAAQLGGRPCSRASAAPRRADMLLASAGRREIREALPGAAASLLIPAGAALAEPASDNAAAGVVQEAVAAAEAAVEQVESVVTASKLGGAVASAVEEAATAVEAAFETEAGGGSAAAADTAIAAELTSAAEAMKEAVAAAQQGVADVEIVEAIKQAAASLSEAAATVQEAAASVQAAAKPAIAAAQPIVKEAVSFISTTDTATLAEGALAAVLLGYVAPPLAQLAGDKIRGYAGDMLPTTVFDALVSHGGNVLVDVRTAAEKEDDGVPDLPDAAKYIELEYVQVEDAGLESRLRNATDVEAESTAIQIAALKQLSKGLTIYLLDSAPATAKAVARELTKRGFSKVFLVAGGSEAWAAAKLRIRPWRPAGLLMAPAEQKAQEVDAVEVAM